MGSQTQDTAEVPPLGEKRKDPEEAPLESPTKKKKQKTTKLPLKTALTDDDYEQIAARLRDEMTDTFSGDAGIVGQDAGGDRSASCGFKNTNRDDCHDPHSVNQDTRRRKFNTVDFP